MDRDTRTAARLAALVAAPVAVLAGLGLFVLLSGVWGEPSATPEPGPTGAATGPVTTQARELTEREEIVCRALAARLPSQLDGLAQRPVTAGPEQNAAYGDPAVVVACGVPPVEVQTEIVYPLPGGVCWVAAEAAAGSVWTTLDREVPVQVTVPAAYDGPGQLVTALTGTVVLTVPSADDKPTGCT